MTRYARPRMFPLQPLLDAAGLTHGALANRVHAGHNTVAVAARHGLTLSEADRWSHRLGVMAEEVWPDLWYAVEDEGSSAA